MYKAASSEQSATTLRPASSQGNTSSGRGVALVVVVVLVVLGVLSGDFSILGIIYETQISQRDEAP